MQLKGAKPNFTRSLSKPYPCAGVLDAVEYGMADDAQICYDDLACHYHLIFEDWEASMTRQAAALSVVHRRECGPASAVRMLDCACGIGTQTLGLAKMGFRISGCDVSPLAIQRAQREAAVSNLDIQFSVAELCCERN